MVTPASSPSPTRWASISSQNFRHSNITCMSGCHLHQVHGPPRREQPCVVRHQGEGVRGAPVLLRLQQLGPLRRLLPRLPGQRQEETPEGGGIKMAFKLHFHLSVYVLRLKILLQRPALPGLDRTLMAASPACSPSSTK